MDYAECVSLFNSYAAAFSAGDTERFQSFYADDVVLELGFSTPPLHGKEAIASFYNQMFQVFRENLTIHELLVNETGTAVAIVVTARFTALADAPEFEVMPMGEGEVVELPSLIYYTLRDGLFSHIKVLPRGEPVKLG